MSMTTVLSLIDAHYLIDAHPHFLDVKQSMKIYLSDVKIQQSRSYNY